MTAVRRPRFGRDPWIVAGLVVIGVGLPAVLATVAGAILIPHNDDFSFRRAALTLYQTGELRFTGWSIMTLVGQLAFTAPLLWLLQGSPWAFAASTAILTTIGIAASYGLARRVLPAPRAAFAVLIVLLVPGVLRYTTTFMTDVPAYAAEMLCLALGAAALGRTDDEHRWRWLVASLLVGCWAFSIREFALAAPVAVVLAAAASDRAGRRGRYLAAGLAVLVVCAGIYAVTQQLPGQTGAAVRPFLPGAAARVVDSTATLAFVLSPALVLFAATWVPRMRRATGATDSMARTRAAVGALAGVTLAALLFAGDIATLLGLAPGGEIRTLIGTVFGRVGSPAAQVLAGARPALYPGPVWGVMNLVALGAAFCAFAIAGAIVGAGGRGFVRLAVRRLGTVIGLLVMFSVLYGAGMIVIGVAVSMYDRYLWPLVLPLSVIMLWRPGDAEADTAGATRGRRPGPAAWLAGVMLTGIAAVSLALLLNSLAFDVARWRVGESEVARGVPATWIDAGFEWVGYHSSDTADVAAPLPKYGTRYTRLWPSYRGCVVVSSTPLTWPGLVLAETRQGAYKMLLVVGAGKPLYIYRATDPTCPP